MSLPFLLRGETSTFWSSTISDVLQVTTFPGFDLLEYTDSSLDWLKNRLGLGGGSRSRKLCLTLLMSLLLQVNKFIFRLVKSTK